jgi:alkanesulfonate monooxygenase SsuD/methylene tetrahydromethanopterin reductase-like flavin-dependent oxidoreductase (luciferase family)
MNYTLPGGAAGLRAAVGDTAVTADEAGVSWFTTMDHYFQMENFATARDPMLEGYNVLNFVAAKTERLRLVARYADAWNVLRPTVEEAAHKLEVLRGHCDALGRDYDAIQKTVIAGVDPEGDIDPFLAQMEQFAKLGVSLVEFAPLPDPVRFVTALGERVISRLAQIGLFGAGLS